MIDGNYIKKVFPELEEISDEKLREGVVRVWLAAVERGNWNRIDDIPFTLLIPETEIYLVEHIRRVTRMAIKVAEARDDLNRDILIAGGLAHDVGKLLEYERKGDRFIKSEFGNQKRHPVSGRELALEIGLPEEVAHIIMAHSREGDSLDRSPEAIVIHHCDFIEFEIAKHG